MPAERLMDRNGLNRVTGASIPGLWYKRRVPQDIAIVSPIYNEAVELPKFAETLAALDPPPGEIVLVDGGSDDGSVGVAEALGLRVIVSPQKGRAAQINLGIDAITSKRVCVVHADTRLPPDAMEVIDGVLDDPRTSLAGFTSLLCGEKTRWVTSLHNWLKTWYAPLLFRPHLFFRGGRLLFGDHAMFFRRKDYLDVGGLDPELTVMEDAELCEKLTTLGRVRLVPRIVRTSDRRIAEWGELKANMIYLIVGVRWGLGLRGRLDRWYPDVRRPPLRDRR